MIKIPMNWSKKIGKDFLDMINTKKNPNKKVKLTQSDKQERQTQ